MAPICQHRGCGCLAVCGISGQVKEQLPDLLCTAPAQVIPEIRHCVTGCGVSTETSCAARSAQFEGESSFLAPPGPHLCVPAFHSAASPSSGVRLCSTSCRFLRVEKLPGTAGPTHPANSSPLRTCTC
ncbi:uncharacterized protein LOC118414362 isoform X2 [Branchiostoma floridae]|uniref:Uncharacterized protein LOC118414362 isoform X2 n=1 Tax=Branchiostoma floridae TaxID=7739 RepID=A0A9J7L363_BRAFL|nr:uncharacterized protein LOC118414362 isoform X2 [Branchiostoma floridae]